MSIDYGEIICSAVDEIVTAKLQGLQYDITKLCTIVDDTFSYQGKYTVSDGTARYEAYSTDIGYKKGNSVLVTIPNGDYKMQKIITGRVSTTDTTPFNYISPMDTMIKITSNIFDDAKTIYGDNIGLLANDQNKSTIIGPLYSITEPGEFAGFTRLGITADFRSWLDGLDVSSGTYGLKALIYTDISDAPGSVKNNAVYELTFSSADMIGNPYQFESYFAQEKVFDISNINNIKQIDIYFYQNGQFYDGGKNYIPWQFEDEILGKTRMNENLFVDNVKIYLGYEMGAFTDETLMLYTPDSLTYHYKHSNLEKNIVLRWIHKIDDKTFELLSSENFDNNKFEIHWFKYNPGNEKIDQYAGKDWEEIPYNNLDVFSCHFIPDIKKQKEQIKAIGLIKDSNTKTIIHSDGTTSEEEIETITPYYSNLLIFENEEEVPDGRTWDAASALSIVCMDNSEGNYYIYNQNGKINNEGDGKGHTRYLKAMYQGAEITSSLGTLDWIKWYFPKESTMLIITDDFLKENNGKKSDEITSYLGVDYDATTRIVNEHNELTSTIQAYAIENYWSFKNSNNTVRCQVSINGVIYEAIEELRFGKGGTNGTNITFLIEFADNNNALIIGTDETGQNNTVNIEAKIYDADNNRVGFTKEQSRSIEWSWHKWTTDADNENNKEKYMKLLNTTGSFVTIESNTDSIKDDNYYILKAKYNEMEAYLPIPLKTKDTSFIEGAKEVIYNHQGIPNYYNDAYVVYYWDNNQQKYLEDTTVKWDRKYDENLTSGNKMSEGYIPKLQELSSRKGYYGLQPSAFYASGYNDKLCISCGRWSQPILIMQSKYDFAMLNQWDGSLTIDEDNGTILSTMLGAGHKNDDNTFSGVLIGDISAGTSNNEADKMTGVYGLHEGAISYALKEDGTATFGKAGRGQIKIDGNKGSIQSAEYINKNGTYIDLDDGKIDIKWPGEDNTTGQILLQSKSPYFTINSSRNTKIISLTSGTDPQNYSKLQSDNRPINGKGLLLNLDKGDLDIKSDKVNILMSGSGAPYFKISIPDGNQDESYTNSLFLLDINNYYLKSKDYKETEFILTDDSYKYYTYQETNYSPLHISDIVAIDQFQNVYKVVNGKVSGSAYSFPSRSEKVDDEGEVTQAGCDSLQMKTNYIASLIPNLSNITASKGFKLDLNNNKIDGYDLYLRGVKGTSLDQSFILDSSAASTPFKIGKRFSVDWDGGLTCTKINSLNDDGRSEYAISISENFYVTKNGAAGGGSASFGNGSFGGLSLGGSALGKNTSNIKLATGVGTGGVKVYNDYKAERLVVSTSTITYVTGISGTPETGYTATTGSATVVTGVAGGGYKTNIPYVSSIQSTTLGLIGNSFKYIGY